ncbi:hypothetical protein [Terrimonas ferruginea]|uniref:hypothetical protein n=1 Tax=Terrimonas ferruginea TaxID=249 RepID=UPI0003F84FF9|nr:hypothetical protein [Terrimonas ferruginea]
MKRIFTIVSLLFTTIIITQSCNNNTGKTPVDEETISEAEIMMLPSVDTIKRNKSIFSRVIPLDQAEIGIEAYRKGGALFKLVFRDKKFGVVHDSTLNEYILHKLPAFISTHRAAETKGYQWQAGFVFGIGRVGTKPCLNVYLMPVLVPIKKGTGVIALDYFQLKKEKKDTALLSLYKTDGATGTMNTSSPDSSFVFDEGALWP